MSVTIIDERLAREYWPNDSPIGKRITLGPSEDKEPWYTIVGVVGVVKNESLDQTPRKSVYQPHAPIRRSICHSPFEPGIPRKWRG